MILASPQAKPLKSTLKESKLSASHYFGNETEKVNSAISSAYMLKSLDDKQPRKFAPFSRKVAVFSLPALLHQGSQRAFRLVRTPDSTSKLPIRETPSVAPLAARGPTINDIVLFSPLPPEDPSVQ